MYYILRNNQRFGPYTIEALKRYAEEGKILLNDVSQHENNNLLLPVKDVFKLNNVSVRIQHNGSMVSQLKLIGKDLLFPTRDYIRNYLLKDPKLIALALVGLAPLFLIFFTFASYVTFYAISLYFSAIWGIFFYYLFATNQVTVKRAVALFFLSQITSLILVNVQSFPPFSFFYGLTGTSGLLSRIVGFVFGVGILEESIKAIPLLIFIRMSKEPVIPQTLVFYGLISGVGFGVFEGVHYQLGVNAGLEYNMAFFMNIARLTSLPFIHAIWAAIAGYFIAFANVYPRNRQALYFLALAIPATLHGFYDVFSGGLIGLAITVFSVLLLVFYLKKSTDFKSKFSN